jgi:hypothetical protein
MATPPRDARGRFTSDGGGESVGGISASIEVDDGGVSPAMARLDAALTQAVQKFNAVKAAADPVTHAMTEIAAGSGRAAQAFSRLDTSVVASGRGTAAFARGMLELSRGVEDFTVAGPLGVMNNLPVIMSNMAAAAGVAATSVAALTAGVSFLGTGAYILYRNWDSVTSLWQEKNPFPKSADDLENMQDRLKEVSKELDKLKGLQSLDNTQLARANTLIAERAKLEKEVTAEKERQKNIDVVAKAKDPEDAKRAATIAGAVGAGEGGDAFRADVEAAMRVELRREIDRARARRDRDITAMDASGASAQVRGEYANTRKNEFDALERTLKGDMTRMIGEMMAGLGRGDPKAMARLRDLMDAGTGVLIGGEGFRGRLDKNARDAADKAESERLIAEGNRGAAAYDAAKKARDEKDARDSASLIAESKRNVDAYDRAQRIKGQMGVQVVGPGEDELQRRALTERGGDLNWRLMELTNPNRVGQSLGLDAYEASIKSQTGLSEEARRLQAILEVDKQIADNTKNLDKLRTPRKVAR